MEQFDPIEAFRSNMSVDSSEQGSSKTIEIRMETEENNPLGIMDDESYSADDEGGETEEPKHRQRRPLSAKDLQRALKILQDSENSANPLSTEERFETSRRGITTSDQSGRGAHSATTINDDRIASNKDEHESEARTQYLLKLFLAVLALATVALIVIMSVQLAERSSTSNKLSTTTPENYSPPWSRRVCPSFPAPPPLPGKKGAAFTLRPQGQQGSWIENLPKVIELKPYWNYRWGLQRIDAQPADIEFVPMAWDNTAKLDSKLETYLAPLVESGQVNRLLGFNEPDQEKQANMTVKDALNSWPKLESFGLPLVSPSCANPNGEWMESFMASATTDCRRVDWIGVHWYGGVRLNGFKKRMQAIYDKYRKPLLITEFAPVDRKATTLEENRHTKTEILNFMKQALPWLEAQDWIAGYAWFSFNENHPKGGNAALFDELGELTTIGEFYASVSNENPNGDQGLRIVSDLFS